MRQIGKCVVNEDRTGWCLEAEEPRDGDCGTNTLKGDQRAARADRESDVALSTQYIRIFSYGDIDELGRLGFHEYGAVQRYS